MAVPSRLARLPRVFGLHGQVALVALVLLVIPWVGYTYVKAMEKLLRENQEQQVVAAARAIATALQDRPKLLELRGLPRPIGEVAKAEIDAPRPVAVPPSAESEPIKEEP